MTIGGALPLGVRAWGWMLRVEWLRRRLSLDDLIAWLEGIPPDPRSALTAGAALLAARRACGWSPSGKSCLKISLVALALLRRAGCPAHLTIGVRDARRPVEAHAWLEIDGVPLDPLASDYVPLRRPEGVGAPRFHP